MQSIRINLQLCFKIKPSALKSGDSRLSSCSDWLVEAQGESSTCLFPPYMHDVTIYCVIYQLDSFKVAVMLPLC